MTQEHPITPPPELVEQWYETADNSSKDVIQEVAAQAARWGADQELEACCEWIYKLMDRGLEWSMDLRTARRPKPPSLKEQALEALASADGADHPIVATVITADQHALIRRALESLTE